jgi:hypothetical protein
MALHLEYGNGRWCAWSDAVTNVHGDKILVGYGADPAAALFEALVSAERALATLGGTS